MNVFGVHLSNWAQIRASPRVFGKKRRPPKPALFVYMVDYHVFMFLRIAMVPGFIHYHFIDNELWILRYSALPN